jgi:hypothetical protein
MRNLKTVRVKQEKIISISCDICNVTYEPYDMGFEEIISIRHEGGFSSHIGDGSIVEIDICDKCFMKKLGKYVRIL